MSAIAGDDAADLEVAGARGAKLGRGRVVADDGHRVEQRPLAEQLLDVPEAEPAVLGEPQLAGLQRGQDVKHQVLRRPAHPDRDGVGVKADGRLDAADVR